VSEHLLACPGCRREEEFYRGIDEAKPAMTSLKVSDGFNQQLLNRVARERFAETRTKAYLPKAAPLVAWRKVVPVAATACVALLAAVVTLSPTLKQAEPQYAVAGGGLDDSYLTAQPDHNPRMTMQLKDNWSLTDQMAQSERISRLSNTVTPAAAYSSSGYNGDLAIPVSAGNRLSPFVPDCFRTRRAVRVIVLPSSSANKEGSDAF